MRKAQTKTRQSRYLIISTPQPLLMKRMMWRHRRRSLSRGSPDRALRRVVCRPGGWLELEKQPIYTYSRGISLALSHHRVGFVLDSVSLSFAACGEGASSRSEQAAEKISSRPRGCMQAGGLLTSMCGTWRSTAGASSPRFWLLLAGALFSGRPASLL